MIDGTWEQVDVWGGMKDGHVVMAPYTNMPDDVKAAAEETQAKITSGELQPVHRADQQAGRLASG